MNELSSPVSVESDNALGDVIDSYVDDPNEQQQDNETSGTSVRVWQDLV
jgi:hypothetical protein